MRVGLVDVDGAGRSVYPNLALMKISAWHKAQGDSVEWANPMFSEVDRVYMSKVFTFSEDNRDVWNCEVVKGGTGYDIASRLRLCFDNVASIDVVIKALEVARVKLIE
jgi:hypothetical protein